MPDTKNIADVIASESKEIEDRREAAKLPKPDRNNGTVGLSLSGGGLRSACFSMGMTQAFHACGIWRLIDYVSSVSGGGYTAGYISNQLARTEEADARDPFPFAPEAAESDAPTAAGPQSPHVRRLMHSGNYLFRPVFFVNRYLFGLVLINVAFFSLVVACSALIAFLWRCLDYEIFRRNADLLNLDDDLLVPFLPAVFFGSCWMAAWIISVWRRNDISTGGTARFFLYLLIPSILIGIALVAGNGDNEGIGVERLTGETQFVLPNSVWATVTGIVAAALLPWIRPQRILQSGINPQSPLERYVFFLASTGLLIGVPLLLIGFFAQENISGFNSHPHRPMVGGDIKNAPVVASLIMEPPRAATDPSWPRPFSEPVQINQTEEPPTEHPVRQAVWKTIVRNAPRQDHLGNKHQTKLEDIRRAMNGEPESVASETTSSAPVSSGNPPAVSDKNPLDQTLRPFLVRICPDEPTDEIRRLDQIKSAMMFSWPNSVDDLLRRKNDHPMVQADMYAAIASIDLQYLHALRERSERTSYSYLYTDTAGQIGPSVSETPAVRQAMTRALLCSAHANHLIQPFLKSARQELKDDKRFHQTRLTPNVRSWYLNLGHWASLGRENNTSDYVRARQLSRRINDCLARSFEIALLDDERLRLKLAKEANQSTDTKDPPSGGREKKLAPEVQAFLAAAKVSDRMPMTPEDGRRLSRLALQSAVQDALRPRSDIRRTISHTHDQIKRLTIFGVASMVFLVSGIFVNLNTVSLHRYYRNRIAQAFVSGDAGEASSIPLSAVDTCRVGGPYHLIGGATGLLRSNLLPKQFASVDPSDPKHRSETDDLRTQDTFLMSKNYCGSELTGFMESVEYERMIPGTLNKVDLADAIAISGAAVSPGNVTNPLIATLMLILNLRLGQWMPNPKRKPKTFPNVLSSLIDSTRRWQARQYFFVSDGGVHENLGLVQLLKRRCRLIISVDASHDPKRHFADLAKAVADVRVHDGIRLVEVETDDVAPSVGLSLIDLCDSEMHQGAEQPFCKSHFKVGRILYPDGSKGTLVLVKPTLTGDESIDLLHYRAKNKQFPHESTSDQFYDPTQVEAYRRLGEHIGKRIGRAIGMDLNKPESFNGLAEVICERLEEHQRSNQNQLPPPKSDGQSASQELSKALSRWLKGRTWSDDSVSSKTWTSMVNAFRGHPDGALVSALACVSQDRDADESARRRAAAMLRWVLDHRPAETHRTSLSK